MKNQYKEIAKIVARVKEKDADAFVELYNSMYRQIYFLALSIVKDSYLAQDVVQETFIKVYNSIQTLSNDISFIAWINRIAYNCALRVVAKNREVSLSNEIIEQAFSGPGSEEPLEQFLSKEESRTIMDFIWELSPEYRTILILRYYEGMKLGEIADCMDCSIGTIKSRLSRGRNILRKRMKSSGQLFMLLLVSGLPMALSIKSYAQEHAMAEPVVKAALHTVKQKLGIISETGAQVPPASAVGVLKKTALAVTAVLCLLLGAGIWGTELPSVEVEYPDGIYTNGAVDVLVTVESHGAVKSVFILSEGRQAPVAVTGKKGEYRVKAESNGTYQVEVTLQNGRKAVKKFEISTIDHTIPKLDWYDWNRENGVFRCLVYDDLSGIDYSKICQQSQDGEEYPPVSWNEASGEVEFRLLDVPFDIKLYDKANNFSIYKIEPYIIEEKTSQ